MTDHVTCRREIVKDDLSPASQRHLDGCSQCERFALGLERALSVAALLVVPPMPEGLVARVLDRVRRDSHVPSPGRPSSVRTRPGAAVASTPRRAQRSRARAVAVALAAVLAVALSVVIAPILGRTPAAARLTDALARTGQLGTARLSLTGTLEGTQNDPEAKRAFSLETTTIGEVAFGKHLRLQGSVTVRRADPGVDLETEDFDVVIVGGRAFDRSPQGLRERSQEAPIGQLFPSEDAVLGVLQAGARGDVEDLGDAVLNGMPTRHLRFSLPPDALLSPFPRSAVSGWTAEAWIDESGTLRQLLASGNGQATPSSPFDWKSSMTVGLSDFGGDVLAALPELQILTVGKQLLLPLSREVSLARFTGATVVGRGVPVESVVADEGFWVGISPMDRVFVRLIVGGESPPRIRAGQRLSFSGTMRRNPLQLESLGVSDAEGASLLRQQGHHIELQVEDLMVTTARAGSSP